MWVFDHIDAISFKDVNSDGLKDVIIITEYILGHGDHAAEDFPTTGIYLQNGNTFTNNPDLDKHFPY